MIKSFSKFLICLILLLSLVAGLSQSTYVFAQSAGDEQAGAEVPAQTEDAGKLPRGVGLKETFKGVGGTLPSNLPDLDLAGTTEPVAFVESVLLKFVINPIFFIAGGVAILVVMYSAARIIFARGEEEGLTAAKNTLTWAALGLGLILLSYTIINNLAGLIGKFF